MNPDKLNFTLGLMTETQERRWKLFFEHRSLAKVAKIEGVGYQRIQSSLHGGVKRAKKQLDKMLL
jgi:hypothetical protein